MSDHEALIREIYAAFNRRDLDTVLAAISDDVVWSNSMTGGHMYGKEAVREYWMRQFDQVQNFVEPHTVKHERDGSYTVRAHQIGESVDRTERLFDAVVTHSITVGDDGLITRFQSL